eukprot:3081743-Pyramimonas_sp.AAC.1
MIRTGSSDTATSLRGGRTLTATFVVAKGEAPAYLRLSGFKGMTFANSYIGNMEQAEIGNNETF